MMKKSLIITLIAMVTLLQADYVVKYNMDGQKMSFMYKNPTTSKMVTTSEDGKVEIYHIKKNSYLVSHGEDGVNVVDMNAMKNKAKEMGFDPSSFMQKQEKPKYSIKKTGKIVKVGGVNGEEWIVKGKQEGRDYETKVIVTNDKDVVKTLRAMFSSMSDMSGGMVADDNLFEMKKGYVMIKADGMKLESFKSKSLSSKEYKLPKVTNTREAFNERNKRSASPKKTTKKKSRAVDSLACYDNPCCGEIAGASVVLKPAIFVNKGGTGSFLVDSATCKKNALGQTTEVAILELKEDNGLVLLTLILDDKNNGVVQKLMDEQTDHGGGNSSIVKADSLSVDGHKATYIHSRNTNQERMDVYLGDNATLSMSRIYKDDWSRDFEGWAEKGWIFYGELKQNVKNWDPSNAIPPKEDSSYVSSSSHEDAQEVEESEDVEVGSGISSDNVDQAVNLLKSFF